MDDDAGDDGPLEAGPAWSRTEWVDSATPPGRQAHRGNPQIVPANRDAGEFPLFDHHTYGRGEIPDMRTSPHGEDTRLNVLELAWKHLECRPSATCRGRVNGVPL